MARQLPLISLIALSCAACTQPGVEVVDKSGIYFGQTQTAALQQPKHIAAKYQDDAYVAPAPLAQVEVATVSEPEFVTVEELAPINVTAVEAPKTLAPLSLSQNNSVLSASVNSTFSWPIEGPILSHYGPKSGGLVNDGINIAAAQGEPIWSAASGEVAYAGSSVADYGNMVILRHSNGWMSAYGHASDLLVKKGDVVKQGDLLGYVGQTGNVVEPQLHFGLRQNDKPIDPLSLLPRSLASK